MHADELLSRDFSADDYIELRALLADRDITEWISAMGVYAPLKREDRAAAQPRLARRKTAAK